MAGGILGNVAADLLDDLDEIRSIAGQLGIRPFTVSIRTRTWSGARIGEGTKTDSVLPIHTGTQAQGNTQPVRVVQKSMKDVIASGGAYSDQDLRVGPFTPAFPTSADPGFETAGGYTDGMVDPVPTTSPTEVQWIVTGPNIPAGGLIYDKIGEEATALHYYVTLRRTGVRP